MTELFNVTHDANNLNEYDSTVTDGGDLSTGTPGLASTTARMEATRSSVDALKNRISPVKTQRMLAKRMSAAVCQANATSCVTPMASGM